MHDRGFGTVFLQHLPPNNVNVRRDRAIVTAQKHPLYSIRAHVPPHPVKWLRWRVAVREIGLDIALAINVHSRVPGLENELSSVVGTVWVGLAVLPGVQVSPHFLLALCRM